MADKRIRIILDSKDAEKNAKELDKSVAGVGRSSDQAVFSMNKLAAAISSVIAIDKVISYADAWTSVQNSLRQVTTTQEQLASVTQNVLNIALNTRTNLQATASLYATLSRSTEKLGLDTAQLSQIVTTVNNTFLAAGASAEEAGGAIRQLSQALASGVLRGDEFNSIAEQAPGILRAVAEETGKTTGELRAFAQEGGITSELLIKALTNYSDAAQEAADKSQRTFGQSLEVSKTNAIAFVGASEALQGAVSGAGTALVALSKNLDLVEAVITAVAAVMAGRMIPSLYASVTAMIASTTAAGGLSVAMGVLGGPVGILGIVAAALYYFTTRASESETTVKSLGASVEDTAASFEKLGLAQQKIAEKSLSEELSKRNEEIEKLNRNLEKTRKLQQNSFRPDDYNNVIDGVKAKIEETQKLADELTAKLAAIKNPVAKMPLIDVLQPDFSRIKTPVIDIAGSAENVKIQKERFKELLDIQSQFWDAVDEEGKQRDADSEIMQRQKNNTDTLRAELETRTLISRQAVDAQYNYQLSDYQREIVAIQNQEALKTAELQKSIEAESQARATQRANELEFYQKNKLDDSALKAEFLEQDKIIAQTHEEELFTIRQDGVNARAELDRAEYQARLASVGQLGDALISLGQGQSKKIFKIGQTLALAQAAVALPTAVMESFKNGGGYPWGLVPAAAMLATGLKNIQLIKSAGGSLGGGGGGGTASASVGGGSMGSGPTIPSTAGSSEQFRQKQVIEIRGISAESLLTGAQLAEILQRDDNVVVALNGAQQDAQRRGVI